MQALEHSARTAVAEQLPACSFTLLTAPAHGAYRACSRCLLRLLTLLAAPAHGAHRACRRRLHHGRALDPDAPGHAGACGWRWRAARGDWRLAEEETRGRPNSSARGSALSAAGAVGCLGCWHIIPLALTCTPIAPLCQWQGHAGAAPRACPLSPAPAPPDLACLPACLPACTANLYRCSTATWARWSRPSRMGCSGMKRPGTCCR